MCGRGENRCLVAGSAAESDLPLMPTCIRPAVAGGNLVLRTSLLGHLQEQRIGQLGHVLVVGDAIVLEDVAQVLELGDDVGGGHGLWYFASQERGRNKQLASSNVGQNPWRR